MRRLPPIPVAYRTEAFEDERAAVLTAVRAMGCTCDPDIEPSRGGHVKVHHDDDCALLRRADVN